MDRPSLGSQLVGPLLLVVAIACFSMTAAIELGAFADGTGDAAEGDIGIADTAGTPATSGSPQPAGGNSGAAASAGGTLSITMGDLFFDPNVITIPANQAIAVDLKNGGALPHNFSVTDHRNPDVKNLGISIDVAPGAAQQTTINAPPGKYYFWCNVPGHEQAGMFGYITVEEGAQITGSKESVAPPSGG